MIYCPPHLTELAKKINRPIYVVGGFIRNQFCNLPLKVDIDIAGDFDGEILKSAGAKVKVVNKKLGTMWIGYKNEEYEYTRFRKEEYALDGAHSPINIEFILDIDEDAKRRDFTANSIYYDVLNKKIIDPLNGVNDAKKKILRCFDPEFVFKSDGLRLLRLVRFSAELGFEIDTNTSLTAIKFKNHLENISPERKRDELDKILHADKKYEVDDGHYKGLKLLWKLGLWEFILPSMLKMEIEQNPKWHKYNVLEHTFMAVKFSNGNIKNLRLAALMHDTGKPVSLIQFGNMHKHAEISSKIAMQELGQAGLKYPNSVINEVSKLCAIHMYDLAADTSGAKMKLFCAQNFEILEKLEALKYADALATGKDREKFFPPRFLYFKDKLIKEKAPIDIRDLKINGNDAIKAGFEKSEIKNILNELWKECIINPVLNNREWLLKQLEKRKL
ncbi:MAG: HD domain-containing protein [Firmicutes bacterium]|nr:HD domain-containing protein [Bacillota bacterium]